MRPIILGYFSNNIDGNKYISFQDLYDPRGVIFQNFRLTFIGPMKMELWIFISFVSISKIENRMQPVPSPGLRATLV